MRNSSGWLLILLTLAWIHLAEAQQEAEKIPRVGFLATGSSSFYSARLDALRQGLRELGYVDAQNIAIEHRAAEGKSERLPALAAELIKRKVNVLVAGGSSAIRAANQASSTIPIVMGYVGDPIGEGFVRSLARPGGNITGLTSISGELAGKRLELLKEAVPKVSRLAFIWWPDNPGAALSLKETQETARSLGVAVQSLEVRSADNFERAFEAAASARTNAVIVIAGGLFNTYQTQIVGLAAKHRLPAMYTEQEYVHVGGLMSYATNIPDLLRRSATYVDKILKGTKPGDLPIERPKKFELVINLKAAKEIGLTIPPNVLARADKVIR